MYDPLDDAPAWVTELGRELRKEGFAELEERRWNESFGNYLVTFGSGRVRIRIVKDLGEWRIDIWDAKRPSNAIGQPADTSPAMLQAVLDGVADVSAISHGAPDRQAAWLLAHLSEVCDMVTQPDTWVALQRLGRQYARQRFGIEVPLSMEDGFVPTDAEGRVALAIVVVLSALMIGAVVLWNVAGIWWPSLTLIPVTAGFVLAMVTWSARKRGQRWLSTAGQILRSRLKSPAP